MDPNNEPPPPEPHRQPPSTAAAAGDLITTFMEITSATAAEAQFFLESHDFDLDSAVSTFLDSSSSSITATTTETAAVETVAAVTAVAGTDAAEISADRRFPASTSSDSTPSASVSDSPSRSRSRSPAPMTRSLYNLRPRKPHSRGGDGGSVGKIRRRRGVHTVADMNSTSEEEGSSGEEDSDQRPEYYTGGEKSGMLVQDPSKVNDVDEIFDQARRTGARRGTADVGQPSASSRSFTGTGRLLVSGATVPSAPQQHPLDAITHTISFWNNGFTVNDGPLRRMDDPENASFLESVKNSECPKELVPAYSKTKVELKLLRRHENFPEPVKQQIPFQGVGRTLASSSNSPPESSAATSSTNAPARATGPVVDDKLPTTSIQLRLADGTRLISRFNYHHTIRDIRTFIDASRPSGPDTYSLQTVGFPPKQLTDLDLTIEEGGLANSVVIQRL